MTATNEGLSTMHEAPTPDNDRMVSSISTPTPGPPITPKQKRRWTKLPDESNASTPLSAALSNPEFLLEPIEALEAIGRSYKMSPQKRLQSEYIVITPNSPKSVASASSPRSSSTSSLSSCTQSPLSRSSSLNGNSCLINSDHKDLELPLKERTLQKSKNANSALGTPRKKRLSTVSPYFLKSSLKRVKGEKISCIPFPPLNANSFGLVQEHLHHDPFRLLIAVIFMTKTRGSVAIPFFYDLITRYPNPAALAVAKREDIVSFFEHLGLQNQRALRCINLAKAWLENPPAKGKRYRRLHYPAKDDGKDIGVNEGPVSDKDERVAWEVGHLAGLGSYAIDSWRIFCRDELRGLPAGLSDRGDLLRDPAAKAEELAKEWTRVLPLDKELRAYLRWRWLRVGFEWDPVSGEQKLADEGFLAGAMGGGVICEKNHGGLVLDAKDWTSGEVGEMRKGAGK